MRHRWAAYVTLTEINVDARWRGDSSLTWSVPEYRHPSDAHIECPYYHSSMRTRTLYKIRVSYVRTFQNIRYAYDTYLMASIAIGDRGVYAVTALLIYHSAINK
jgi:hypothetical protein